MIKLIHVSDIHFGSGEGHGRPNPATGLNIRFEDFITALKKTVDYTLESKADIFLFSGDAYKNASPEPIYQKMFARELKRLSDAAIPTLLLVGNHDQIWRGSNSHSLSVFQSLAVPNVVVLDRPQLLRIKTKKTDLQLIAIPHITRHVLMTQERLADASGSTIEKNMVAALREILNGFYAELDPTLPTVTTAHVMLDRARAGAECELMVGYTLTFPQDIFIDARVDYVALGHVHRHQILQAANPCIAYAGSLERVDFGEEHEDKGFIEADIERGKVDLRFHSISPRPFITVEVDLSQSENPTEELIRKAQSKLLENCVMRINYKVPYDLLPEIDETKIRQALSTALSLRFRAEVISKEQRGRLPEIDERSVTNPGQALEKYLDEVYPDNKELLMARAQELIAKLEGQKED
ncbi:MAG: exonuclease SbcCD subunit D [Candidatus Obscuribacterales bacterium]|nr:exonuclease SbcCD subunit D [Candidatus Obscuribacterales bacterium]